MLISAVQHTDSVIHINVFFLYYLINHYGLLQDIEYSFLRVYLLIPYLVLDILQLLCVT